jgi:hypothetical protein
MAFTNVSLNTQTLLETTFISDMRLILNANVTVVKSKLEDVINTLEIDLVNKYIGVDNYVNQVKTNNVILGNGITFMDSTNTIGSLTKSSGKSILSIDKLIIQAGGTIDMTGAANAMAITRLGVGIPLASVTADGFYVGNSSTSVKSQFYGEVSFPAQAITQSTEGSTNTIVTTTAINVSSTDYYYGVLKLSKTSKQFIYVTIKCADNSPSSSKPIILFVYEDAASRPDNGQSFTVIVKEYINSSSATIATTNWGDIKILPGFTLLANGTPGLINSGTLVAQTTASTAIGQLAAGTPVQHITTYNTNVQASTTSSRLFGSSVTLTKFENTMSGLNFVSSRFVITSSHNVKITN